MNLLFYQLSDQGAVNDHGAVTIHIKYSWLQPDIRTIFPHPSSCSPTHLDFDVHFRKMGNPFSPVRTTRMEPLFRTHVSLLVEKILIILFYMTCFCLNAVYFGLSIFGINLVLLANCFTS